ncbi:MAG: c-type cytochrome [Solirubrobacteraceae bacterium]
MDAPARTGAVGAAALALLAAGCGGSSHAPARAQTTAVRPSPAGALFVAVGCGDCHALRAAGARGQSGPDFDTSEVLTPAQIRTGILEGANGMPSYRGKLSGRQLDRLTALIAGAMRGRR